MTKKVQVVVLVSVSQVVTGEGLMDILLRIVLVSVVVGNVGHTTSNGSFYHYVEISACQSISRCHDTRDG